MLVGRIGRGALYTDWIAGFDKGVDDRGAKGAVFEGLLLLA